MIEFILGIFVGAAALVAFLYFTDPGIEGDDEV